MKRHSRRSATKSKTPSTTIVSPPPEEKAQTKQPEVNYGLWLRHNMSSILTSGYMFHGVEGSVPNSKVPLSNQEHV